MMLGGDTLAGEAIQELLAIVEKMVLLLPTNKAA